MRVKAAPSPDPNRMEQQDKSSSPTPYPGSVPMTRIDGAKIRSLRESKGLTQLYLSTVVGVTTDTISRWENRRYPSIKLENAEKLALALEVDLVELLEQEDTTISEDFQENKPKNLHVADRPHEQKRFRLLSVTAILVLTLILTGTCLWFFFMPEKTTITVSAERLLPPHVAEGQTFPVLIRVKTSEPVPVSFILKEIMPDGCITSPGEPPFTTIDPKDNAVKWIAKTETDASIFSYIVKAPIKSAAGNKLQFDGSVTLKQEAKKHWELQGAITLTIEPYHWADRNRDNMIDDEEILAVYDLYNDIKGLRFDRDLIDTIWAVGGYSWNEEKNTYIILD